MASKTEAAASGSIGKGRDELATPMSSAPTTSDGAPSLLPPPKTPEAMAGLDLRTSDTAILSHWPTPLLRLVVLLSPVVRTSARLVRLATWTGGPGTSSHSFLLLLAWWGICLYGYEVVRFAPQLALLVVLACTGLKRAMQVHTKTASAAQRPTTADTVNATVEDMAVLADFCSALWSSIGAPIMALLSWQDATQTTGLAVFAITSWPVWLVLFSGSLGHAWDILSLQAGTFWLSSIAQKLQPHLSSRARRLSAATQSYNEPIWTVVNNTHQLIFDVLRFLRAALTRAKLMVAPAVLRVSSGAHPAVFPILSLRVRHLLLITGTIALTWCAPWSALIRHALWRSAFVRHASRTIWSIFSGQIFIGGGTQGSHAYVGRLDEPVDSFGYNDIDSLPSQNSKTRGTATQKGKVSRHEDVVYQFSIFENQRWWMGLDWTAALLPQERPSWADESHSPVSPPASFSLPPAKVTLTPTPSSSDLKRCTRRVIRWQWIDADWMVAGRAPIGGSNSGSSSNAASTVNGDISTLSGVSALSSPGAEDPSWKDVDADGWQYGDNAWEKMSKKVGMGRYTRRRRWIRRAVLTEVVQTDYHPTDEEIAEAASSSSASSKDDASIESTTDTIMEAYASNGPSSTSLKSPGSLRERLSRVAGGSEATE